jgi:hypothetical protein
MLREQGGKNTKKLSDKYKAMLSGLVVLTKLNLKTLRYPGI